MNSTFTFSSNSSGKISLIKLLLFCGIASSVLYVFMCIIVPIQLPAYDSASQTISELSAVGVPTRPLWVAFGIAYSLLVAAYGWSIFKFACENRRLRLVGILLITYGIVGLGWPLAPMHQREVLAAGGGTISDTMHIVFSMVSVVLMLLAMSLGALALGKRFRIYTVATILLMLVLGIFTGIDAPKLEKNLPTPWLGVSERIMIGLFLLWVIILAIVYLRRMHK